MEWWNVWASEEFPQWADLNVGYWPTAAGNKEPQSTHSGQSEAYLRSEN